MRQSQAYIQDIDLCYEGRGEVQLGNLKQVYSIENLRMFPQRDGVCGVVMGKTETFGNFWRATVMHRILSAPVTRASVRDPGYATYF